MDKKKTIESQVKDTILEEPRSVKIGARTYEVAPPTIATLILASEAVSRLPELTLDPDRLVQECFYAAKDCRVLGEIAAILILGARRSESREAARPCKWGCLGRLISRRRKCRDALAEEILLSLSPKDLFNVISGILATMQLSDFFGLTTFLSEVNLLHQTKVGN